MTMFQKILVAIKNPEIAPQVFAKAISLAKGYDAELMLLSLISPCDQSHPTLPVIKTDGNYKLSHNEDLHDYLQQWESLQREAIEFLISLTDLAIAQGVNAEYTLEFGDPRRMICQMARIWGADAIVMGRCGLNKISEFVMGSISNYVHNHAPCHVLTVPGVINSTTNIYPLKALASVS
jgi:nucleotide-binding universal stress UspA family protein